ncbi:MAG: hypothetical protein EAS52_21040 [Parapedobacter sp.]|nr:MAG: hypothetical protein EAS52_21040 [Parapedobacter sp.]
MENILFNDWQALLRILIVGVLVYVIVIVILRISGKRTLSQMKEFNFIVSVAVPMENTLYWRESAYCRDFPMKNGRRS